MGLGQPINDWTFADNWVARQRHYRSTIGGNFRTWSDHSLPRRGAACLLSYRVSGRRDASESEPRGGWHT